MADIKSQKERSLNMSKIRSKGTKPEDYIRKKLFNKGYRYYKNSSKIPGHPDIWMPKYHTAIFVNGCYWHRHNACKYAYMPKSNISFWEKKFQKNVERDAYVREKLKESGIKNMIIWECTIKKMMKSEEVERDIMDAVELFLRSKDLYIEL